jgi:hypothetical protein
MADWKQFCSLESVAPSHIFDLVIQSERAYGRSHCNMKSMQAPGKSDSCFYHSTCKLLEIVPNMFGIYSRKPEKAFLMIGQPFNQFFCSCALGHL